MIGHDHVSSHRIFGLCSKLSEEETHFREEGNVHVLQAPRVRRSGVVIVHLEDHEGPVMAETVFGEVGAGLGRPSKGLDGVGV